MRVSHVWFSDHSICYLELGALAPGRMRKNGTVGNPRGEATVFMGYDWFIKGSDFEFSRKDLHPQQDKLDALTNKIVGASIESASLSEGGNELEISLSVGYTIASISPDNDGPDWSVTFNK